MTTGRLILNVHETCKFCSLLHGPSPGLAPSSALRLPRSAVVYVVLAMLAVVYLTTSLFAFDKFLKIFQQRDAHHVLRSASTRYLFYISEKIDDHKTHAERAETSCCVCVGKSKSENKKKKNEAHRHTQTQTHRHIRTHILCMGTRQPARGTR